MTRFNFNVDHINAPNIGDKNYSIDTLEVLDDFPISITEAGKILSVYGDMVWDLTPYSNHKTRIYFESASSKGSAIDNINVARYKKLMLWIIYARRYPLSCNTVKRMSAFIRFFIKICLEKKIDIANLHRFPILMNEIQATIKPSTWNSMRSLLELIFIDREILGFIILTNEQIFELNKRVGRYIYQHQTPFIPERIFHKILERCTSIVCSYNENITQFEALYRTCLRCVEQMRNEFGLKKKFADIQRKKGKVVNAIEYYTGRNFNELVSDHKVREAMLHVIPLDKELRVFDLSSYLSHVAMASRILIAAFTGMRDKEHGLLLGDCHVVRQDDFLGDVHFLKGVTTKTVKDRTAYWVASPAVEQAVKSALSISELRKDAAVLCFKHDACESKKLYLFPLTSEPWIGGRHKKDLLANTSILVKTGALYDRLKYTPNLFPGDFLKITKEDIENAIRMTPDLDLKKFSINALWRLSWHQFRRTFVCLALGSGISLPTVSWQLKHRSILQTLYYGNNYFSMPLDPHLKKEFEIAQLEVLLLKCKELNGEEYITANGIRKDSVLRSIRSFDEKTLAKELKDGRVAIKNTALGVCTNPSPCEYGGWENVSECVNCTNGLILKANKPRVIKMLNIVESDLAQCDEKHFLYSQSLLAQKMAIMEALNAIK